MLDSSFNEEYRRFTNEITSNNESFFINSAGNLVFTTPIFTSNGLKYDVENFVLNNETPDNVNLIVDSIAIFSTNPNCQNYLPLKLDLGSKPELEFSDVTFTKLENYKIIVNPPINLNSIQNRAYDKTPISFNSRPLRLIDVVESGDIFAFIYQNGNDEADRQLWLFNSTTKTWGQITIPNIFLMKANPFYIIVWSKQAGSNFFYNVKLGVLEEITSTPKLVDFSIQNDIVNINIIDSPNLNIQLYSRDLIGANVDWILTTEYILFNPMNEILPVVPTFYLVITIYNRDKIFLMYENKLRVYEFDIKLGPVLILSNDNIIYKGELEEIYIGGSNINEPYISLFTKELNGANSILNWYYIISYKEIVAKNIFNLKPHHSFIYATDVNVLDSLSFIKRYRNQIYFYLKKDVQILNLDTGYITAYNLNQLVNSPVFPPISPTYPLIVNFSDNNFIIVGDKLGYYFGNSRELLDIYRLTFNYVERTFSYQITGDRFIFNITLPNNANILDMEIFKFVIDCRVRFTKAKLNINAPTKLEDSPLALVEDVEYCNEECGIENSTDIITDTKDCKTSKCKTAPESKCLDGKCKTKKECLTKCNRKVGGVGRILGYVGEDFTVADFLKLYK